MQSRAISSSNRRMIPQLRAEVRAPFALDGGARCALQADPELRPPVPRSNCDGANYRRKKYRGSDARRLRVARRPLSARYQRKVARAAQSNALQQDDADGVRDDP